MTSFMKAVALERKFGEVQEVTIFSDGKTVGFMNRSGEPTALLFCERDGTATINRRFLLVQSSNDLPAGDFLYVGSAEFSGGQLLLHLFEAENV